MKDEKCKKEVQIQKRMSIGMNVLIAVMLFSATVFAGEIVNQGNYSGHNLTCTSKCYRGRGVAQTKGAVKPYSNYAAVVIYGQDGSSQGTTYATGSKSVDGSEEREPAIATMYGSNLSKAVTYHAMADSSGAFTDSFLNQLVYTVEK